MKEQSVDENLLVVRVLFTAETLEQRATKVLSNVVILGDRRERCVALIVERERRLLLEGDSAVSVEER